MREPVAIIACFALAFGVGCGSNDAPIAPSELERFLERGPQFVTSTTLRRQALEASVVNRENGYSRLRLAHYGLDHGGWDALEVFNPPVRPMTLGDLGRFESAPDARTDGAFAPSFEGPVTWTHDQMVSLGRHLFETYPVQIDPALVAAVDSEARAEDVGLWTDRRGRLGGLVRVRLPDGRESFSMTCATCHASPASSGTLTYGRTNAGLDRDKIARLHAQIGASSQWGAGQVDVTPDGVDNPTAITDLRPVRYQSHLHWAATLRNSPEALSVRIETLLITSHGQAVRPPREVAFALAYYLWSLGDDDDVEQGVAAAEKRRQERGHTLFSERCAACHYDDGTTAGTADPALIGTDTAVLDSPMRTTGRWRIPSLWRVSERSQFLHDGSVDSLDALFDPTRLEHTPGHVFGTDLSASQRQDLLAYLHTL